MVLDKLRSFAPTAVAVLRSSNVLATEGDSHERRSSFHSRRIVLRSSHVTSGEFIPVLAFFGESEVGGRKSNRFSRLQLQGDKGWKISKRDVCARRRHHFKGVRWWLMGSIILSIAYVYLFSVFTEKRLPLNETTSELMKPNSRCNVFVYKTRFNSYVLDTFIFNGKCGVQLWITSGASPDVQIHTNCTHSLTGYTA